MMSQEQVSILALLENDVKIAPLAFVSPKTHTLFWNQSLLCNLVRLLRSCEVAYRPDFFKKFLKFFYNFVKIFFIFFENCKVRHIIKEKQ